jgi:quercetin dioxygenase-like cupin family protein
MTGTNMELIIAVAEVPPGASIPRHFHHGEEAVYVLEGGTLELPNGPQLKLEGR